VEVTHSTNRVSDAQIQFTAQRAVLSCFFVMRDVLFNRTNQVGKAPKCAATNPLACDVGKPAFHQIKPRREELGVSLAGPAPRAVGAQDVRVATVPDPRHCEARPLTMVTIMLPSYGCRFSSISTEQDRVLLRPGFRASMPQQRRK
jgi:hypothetical protein